MDIDIRKAIIQTISTSDSLQRTKEIFAKIPERSFHAQIHILYDLRTVLGPEPKTYLEIGTYCGASASLLLSHPYPTTVICVDPMNLDPSHYRGSLPQRETIEKNISVYPNSDQVTLHQNLSNDPKLIEELQAENLQIDLLFIDGDHRYDAVLSDFHLFAPFVASGGFIVFDDYYDQAHSPEVRPAVNDLVKTLLEDKIYSIFGPIPNLQKVLVPSQQKALGEFVLYKN